MLHHLLEKYIPSASYVAYLKEHNYSFSDFETAGILHQIGLPPMEEIEAYRELLGETEDEVLRVQLNEEISWNLRVMDMFKAGGAHIVYIISSTDPDDDRLLGICANYEAAIELGIRNGEAFEIEKYRMLVEYTAEPIIKKYYLNPYMSGCDDWRESVKTYHENDFSHGIGTFIFRKDGVLTYMYSSEAEEGEDDAENMKRYYARDRFTNAYINYPNPFNRGDVVQFVRSWNPEDWRVGLVNTSQNEWVKFQTRIKNGLYVDQSDASLTVEFLQKNARNARFVHEHIPPIFLNCFELIKGDPQYELFEAASWLLRGEGSLDWFTDCYETFREAREKD